MSLASPIERLFSRLGLGPVRRVEPLSGGRLNCALRINGEYVLRCREPARATGSLQREVAVLARVGARVPSPRLVASGVDDLLGEYVVQEWLPGQPLLRAWLENPDVPTREWWLAQWIEAMRALHREVFRRPAELPRGDVREYPSWRAYVEARVRRRLDGLMRAPGSDRELVLAAERYLRRHAPVLEDAPFCLIHRDLHFGNVLVEGPRLVALLDFELTEIGALDYELDTIYRFLRDPAGFAGPELRAGGRLTPARFASVWVRLRRGYPELFRARHLRERLALYALDHTLSCLLQAWGAGTTQRAPGAAAPLWRSETTADAALCRLREILEGRYGPE